MGGEQAVTGLTQKRTRMHDHFASTVDAYNETQWNEEIRSGDVLVIASEGVIGILDRAWPVAITVAHGELHTWNRSAHLICDGDYTDGLALALGRARELGFAINPLHAPVITSPEPEPEPEPAPEASSEDAYYDSLCPSCDGYGMIEIFHPSTDGLIGSVRCPDRKNHPVSLVKRKPEPCRYPSCCSGGCSGDVDCPPF